MILSLLSIAFSVWTAWSVCTFLIHYRRALGMQVPILMSPVGQKNVAWLVAQDLIVPLIARLPSFLSSWTKHNRRNWIWMFADRGEIHRKYGRIIAFVTPAEIQVWIMDKDVINEILRGKERAAFDKPRKDARPIDFLAPHLITADGDTWKRHRRIVAKPFTQRNNRSVWRESLHQGTVLAEEWLKNSEHGVRTVWKDCEKLTMNIIVTAGFGLSRDKLQHLDDRGDDLSGSYSSLSYIISNISWTIVIPGRMWFPSYVPSYPKSLRNFFVAIRALRAHMIRMVAESRESSRSAQESSSDSTAVAKADASLSDNLLSALIRHSEELTSGNQTVTDDTTTHRSFLTDNELYANIFGIAFAGHETVAHTLGYAVFLLAAHSHIQAWVVEEIHAVLGQRQVGSVDLDQVWPLLQRTRALLYETLRLFTPVPNLLKWNCSKEVVPLQVGDRTIPIPPRAYVLPSLWALHSAEEYWGHDSLDWNPKRWITRDTQGGETFTQPGSCGTFLAWSDGARSCPGMRFSQVEFVAICTALLTKYRILAVQFEGEDHEATIGRVKAALHDSISKVTLMVRNPEKIPIRLEER